MRGTKFMVVRLKELLKTAVFVVLGVIILLGLAKFFLGLGEESKTGEYKDGTYYGSITAGEEGALVAVTVTDGKISAGTMQEQSENLAALYPMVAEILPEVGAEVVRTQSLSVAVKEGSAYSAKLVLDAVAQGLEEAKK